MTGTLNRRRGDRAHGSADTRLIARGTVIHGDVRLHGAPHLDGSIDGTLLVEDRGALFTLGEHGDVHVASVVGAKAVPACVCNRRTPSGWSCIR